MFANDDNKFKDFVESVRQIMSNEEESVNEAKVLRWSDTVGNGVIYDILLQDIHVTRKFNSTKDIKKMMMKDWKSLSSKERGMITKSVNNFSGGSYDIKESVIDSQSSWDQDAEKPLAKGQRFGWDGLNKKEREILLHGLGIIRRHAKDNWGKLNPRVRMSLTKNYNIKESTLTEKIIEPIIFDSGMNNSKGLYRFLDFMNKHKITTSKKGRGVYQVFPKDRKDVEIITKAASKHKMRNVEDSAEWGHKRESFLHEAHMLGKNVIVQGKSGVVKKYLGNEHGIEMYDIKESVGHLGEVKLKNMKDHNKEIRNLTEAVNNLYETDTTDMWALAELIKHLYSIADFKERFGVIRPVWDPDTGEHWPVETLSPAEERQDATDALKSVNPDATFS